MTTKSCEEALEALEEIMDSRQPLTPETLVVESDIDSLDMLEWLYVLDCEADDLFEDDTLLDRMATMTLGELYKVIVSSPRSELTTS